MEAVMVLGVLLVGYLLVGCALAVIFAALKMYDPADARVLVLVTIALWPLMLLGLLSEMFR